MDWAIKLQNYSKDDLQKLERRAEGFVANEPDTPRGKEAALLLPLIRDERERRGVKGNIAQFLEDYPDGFTDPLYRFEERDDKVVASALCKMTLSEEAFKDASGSTEVLIRAVKELVNETNLIQGSFEKPKLFDAIQDPANSEAFLKALWGLLHGEGESPERLEKFSEYLDTLGLRKWTYGTYFLFMNDPEHEIFVKPTSIQKAADIAAFELDYDPAPTARGYRRILEFVGLISSSLKAKDNPLLHPEDNIDTQSFIWRMAPTGKFAK